MRWSQFIQKNWKQTFETQIGVYSRNNCPGHGSGQSFPANNEFRFFWYFWCFNVTPLPSVFISNFEYLFVVWVRCEQRYMTANCYPKETKPIWNFSWNFSIADIFRGFCWNPKLGHFKEYFSMTDSNGYFSAYHVVFEDSLPYR